MAEQLRDLLDQRTKQVSDEVLRSGGQVSPEQLETLDRLARLVEISGATQAVSPRKRWPIMVVLGFTLLVVSILLFARVSQTEIELDLTVTETTFVMSSQQMLTDALQLSALGVSGLQEIQLPRSTEHLDKTPYTSEMGDLAIRLSRADDGKRQGTITLAALMLPEGTHVRLRTSHVPNQFRLSFKVPGLVLRAHVNGPVQISWPGAPIGQIDFSRPTTILLQPGPDEVDLDLTFVKSSVILSPQLAAENLSLLHIEQFTENGAMVVRPASTLLSGTLYFESLNGRKRLLRSAEALHFTASKGEIRTLRLDDTSISLCFHGRVRGMTSGLGESQRSLMPTYLEYLHARHGLSLLWGTTLYLFGLLIGILRWLGVSV